MKVLSLITCSFVLMSLIAGTLASQIGGIVLCLFAVSTALLNGNLDTYLGVFNTTILFVFTTICAIPSMVYFGITKTVLVIIQLCKVAILQFKRVMSFSRAILKIMFCFLAITMLKILWPIMYILDFIVYIVSYIYYLRNVFLQAFSGIFGLPRFILLTLVGLLMADAADSDMRFDPTKRIPLLTESNYPEWAWRMSTVLVTLGVGVKLLTMNQPQQDVAAQGIEVAETQEVRKIENELKLQRTQFQLSDGEEADKCKELIDQLKEQLQGAKEREQESIKAKLDAEDPFQALNARARLQCFRLLSSTISSELDFLVMNLMPTQFEEAWFAIRDYFQTNTRGARMDAKLQFFQLEMPEDMKFAEFKNKIDWHARQINNMSIGGDVISDDDKLTILFRGVRRYHLATFKTTLEILEQDPNPLSFEEAYKKMMVVARRSEREKPRAPEQGMFAHSEAKKSSGCWQFEKTGNCRFGNKCRFTHTRGHSNSSSSSSSSSTSGSTSHGCTFCGGRSHLERDCNKKKKASADARNRGNKNKERAAFAKVKEENAALRKKLHRKNREEKANAAREERKDKEDDWQWDDEFCNLAATQQTEFTFFGICSCLFLVLVGVVVGWYLVSLKEILSAFFVNTCHRCGHTPKSAEWSKGPANQAKTHAKRRRPPNRKKAKKNNVKNIQQNQLNWLDKKIQRIQLTINKLDAKISKHKDGSQEFAFVSTGRRCLSGGVLDSGCSSHMFKDHKGFKNFTTRRIRVVAAGGRTLWAVGTGDCRRTICLPDGRTRSVLFKDALYVPELEYDLISTGKLDKQGYTIITKSGSTEVTDKDGHIVIHSVLRNGLYCIAVPIEVHCNSLSSIDLLHRRFGHASPKYLHQWLKKNQTRRPSFCDACAVMRSHKRPFKHSNSPKSTVKKPLDLVVSDLCGPFRVASKSGSQYFGTIVDVCSRFVFVFFVRTKDEVSTRIRDWYKYIKTQTGKVPKAFQSDGGGEYVSDDTRGVFVENGTRYVTTAAASSNQNAIAERSIRTVKESGKAMMEQAGARNYKSLWEEAIRFAAFVRNLTPHSALDMRSPASLFPLGWMKAAGLHASIRVWGCKCYVYDSDCKLSAKARLGVFVGVDMVKKGWRVMLLDSEKIVVSRNVTFDESDYPLRSRAGAGPAVPNVIIDVNTTPLDYADVQPSQPTADTPPPTVFEAATRRTMPREPSGAAIRNMVNGDSAYSVKGDYSSGGATNPPTSGTSSLLSLSEHIYTPEHTTTQDSSDDEEHAAAAKIKKKFPKRAKKNADPTVPNSYKQAEKSEEKEQWKAGMDLEYYNLQDKHHTWTQVSEEEPKRKNAQILGNRWVYRKKEDPATGGIIHKCRLTVKGYMQDLAANVDVYSAVAQLKSFRIIIALCAVFGLTPTHYDFDQAFVQSSLPEPVYMEHPEGFPGPMGTCLKLLKSLYGLKAAPKLWSELLRDFLITIGFIACISDQCVLYHTQFLMFLVTFSDDIIVATKNERARTQVVDAIAARFKIKVLGKLSKYVGIEVSYGANGSISLCQQSYILSMLSRYNMADCKPVNTPAAPGATLLDAPSPNDADVSIPYKSAVGSLWYASRGTRPDIEYATNTAAQFASNFAAVHWQAVKRIFRYLKSCPSACLTYVKEAAVSIVAYSDSDWGSDSNSRRSKSGYVVLVAGGAVVWQTKTQRSVALSSCEAEYYAMTEAIKELLWLTNMLTEIKVKFETPVLYVDNQGAIALAQNPVNHQRTKHIDIRFHFIRDAIRSGKIIVKYVGTDENIADMFTKALAKILFSKHAMKLVHDVEEEKCCLVRTKQTILNGRNPNTFYATRQEAKESLESSLNNWGVYLECECGRGFPLNEESQMWEDFCPAGHRSLDHTHYLVCSVCSTELDIFWFAYVDARAPARCTNVYCSSYTRPDYAPADESKTEE